MPLRERSSDASAQTERTAQEAPRLPVERAEPKRQQGEAVVAAAGGLRRLHRLELTCSLLGGIAHDFGNLLTSIMGYASILQLRSADDPELGKSADVIVRAAQKGSGLTGSLLSVARKDRPHNAPVDVHEILAGVASALRSIAGDGFDVVMRLDAAPSTVVADERQLHRALLELGVNACEAMPQGGDIRFETGVVDPDEAYRASYPASSVPKLLALSVTDAGVGIPAEISARVFEPFFTTRSGDENAGLGLAVVSRIVGNHNGTVSFRTVPAGGTTFTVSLPLQA